ARAQAPERVVGPGVDRAPAPRGDVDLVLVLGVARLALDAFQLEEIVHGGHEYTPSGGNPAVLRAMASWLRGQPSGHGRRTPRRGANDAACGSGVEDHALPSGRLLRQPR